MTKEDFTTITNSINGAGSNALPTHIIGENSRGTYLHPLESQAFENGDLHILGDINDGHAQGTIMLMREAARKKKKLRLFINSPGGSVTAGLAMLDAMTAYPYELSVFCTGLAASMGAVLLAGGRVGHRYILPHSKVMIHEPLIAGGLGGSATSIQRTAESIIETKKVLNSLLAKFTGRTVEEIDKCTAFDNFFNAEEAIEFGLCDKIATGYED